MKILIAEDDPVSRRLLEATLLGYGYQVIVAADGARAWEIMQENDAPSLVVSDLMMPVMDGIELLGKIRRARSRSLTYLIMLTSQSRKEDIVQGLQAGADDYICKPFDRAELRARVQVGERMLELQHSLAERVRELEESRADVKRLLKLLPMCSKCKRVRDDRSSWEALDSYFGRHADVQISSCICPDCHTKMFLPAASGQR